MRRMVSNLVFPKEFTNLVEAYESYVFFFLIGWDKITAWKKNVGEEHPVGCVIQSTVTEVHS